MSAWRLLALLLAVADTFDVNQLGDDSVIGDDTARRLAALEALTASQAEEIVGLKRQLAQVEQQVGQRMSPATQLDLESFTADVPTEDAQPSRRYGKK